MSNSEFDHYLALIGKLLQLTRQQQESIGLELRDHLESRVADLMELGAARDAAIQQALEEFGDAAVMAKNLQWVSQFKRRRWIMRFATFSIVGCFLVAILTMALWPQNARFGAPEQVLADIKRQEPEVSTRQELNPSAVPQDEAASDPFSKHAAAPMPSKTPSVFEINQQIETILRQTVDLEFEELEWRQVRQYLFERYQINVVTHQSALNDSLNEEELISISLKGLPLEVGLKHLLNMKNATFTVKDGTVMVISLDNSEDPELLSIRSYDCRALIRGMSLSRSTTKFGVWIPELQANPQTGGMGGMGGAGGMFQVPPETVGGAGSLGGPGGMVQYPQEAQRQAAGSQAREAITSEELLRYLVMTMTDHEDNWGDHMTLSVVNGFLIVRQKREILQDIEVFLNLLEQNLKHEQLDPETN